MDGKALTWYAEMLSGAQVSATAIPTGIDPDIIHTYIGVPSLLDGEQENEEDACVVRSFVRYHVVPATHSAFSLCFGYRWPFCLTGWKTRWFPWMVLNQPT